MRFLHVSNFPANTLGISEGFAKLGEVLEFNWETCLGDKDLPGMNEQLVSLALDYKPDLIFMEEAWRPAIKPESIRAIKSETDTVAVNWNGDYTHDLLPSMVALGEVVDCTLVSNWEQVAKLVQLGVKADFLAAGCATGVYRPVEPDREKYPADIVFLGSGGRTFWPNWGLREEMCCRVYERYGDRFRVCGRGWGDGYPFVHDFVGVGEPEAEVYSSAKIALGINAITTQGYTSARMWKAMGSGVLYMPHRFSGIEKWFNNHEHLVWWDGLGDLMKWLDYYLNHSLERQGIAVRGRAEVHQSHSWEARARELVGKFL